MANPYGITATSLPIYDELGMDDSWNCAMWLAWLDELQKKLIQWEANEIWLTAWDQVGKWDWQWRNCHGSANFLLMLSTKGIETSDDGVFFNDGYFFIDSNPTDYQAIEDERPFDPIESIEDALENFQTPLKFGMGLAVAYGIYRIVKR